MPTSAVGTEGDPMSRTLMSRIFLAVGLLGLAGALVAVGVGHAVDFGVPLLFIGLFWLLQGWGIRKR
jgi:hypothetical protein